MNLIVVGLLQLGPLVPLVNLFFGDPVHGGFWASAIALLLLWAIIRGVKKRIAVQVIAAGLLWYASAASTLVMLQ